MKSPALAFLFEYLKLLQAQHRHRQLSFRAKQIRSICPSESSTLLDETKHGPEVSIANRIGLPCIDAIIWITSYNMGYLMMLTVMLYNGWIFISVIIGSGIGYFIFGQSFMKINLQNCQLIRSTFCMRNCSEPDEVPRDGESTPAIESASASNIPSCHRIDTETSVIVHNVEEDT
ncbi:hypothetical protein Trydic_g18822 [Trypoxylus dichotomus]